MAPLKGITPQTTPTPNLGLFSLNSVLGQSKSSQVSIKSLGKAAIPVATPLPSVTTDLLNAIIANSRSTFQATKQIVTSASSQAASDRAAGRSLFDGMQSYTRTVHGLTGAISNNASAYAPQRRELTAEQLGEIGKTYSYFTVRDSLTEGAAAAFGVSKEALKNRSTLDLLFDNLGLTSNSASSGAQTTITNPGHIISGGAISATGGTTSSIATGLTEGAPLGSQVLGALGAAYSAFQVFNNWGKSDPISGAVNGFTAGAYIGGVIGGGPFGAAVGGAIGGVVGLVSGFFKKSGKSQDQLGRDQVRSMMIEGGMINESWQLPLADGSLYDIGKDGKFKLTNTDGTERRAYEVDFKNPLAEQTVAMLQPLAFLITGGDPKLANDFTGYFVNAALSNAKTIADARKNAVAIFSSAKMEPEKIAQAIVALVQRGSISEERGKAYLSGLASLVDTGTKASTETKATSKATKKAA